VQEPVDDVTVVLLVVGTLVFLITEWRSPKTLGPLEDPGKLLAVFFTAVMRVRRASTASISPACTPPAGWPPTC
jgi:trk system potassium uptake protein TrkH